MEDLVEEKTSQNLDISTKLRDALQTFDSDKQVTSSNTDYKIT